MNNGNETIGVTVVSNVPKQLDTGVPLDAPVRIEFSADLNRETIKNCMVVLEDWKGIYDGASSLKDASQYNIVKGSVKYADRIIEYTPEQQFKTDTRYIVILNNTIRDVTGAPLIKKRIFSFTTEVSQGYGSTKMFAPQYGMIYSEIPEVSWKDIGAPSYIVQVSKSPLFESLVYENFIVPGKDNTYTDKDRSEIPPEELAPEPETFQVITAVPDFVKQEGVYYVRVRPEGGKWCGAVQFFIKIVTDAVVAEDDQDDGLYLKDFLADFQEETEILELFPPDGTVNQSLKTNIFYVKMAGMVDESRISFPDCHVEGEPFDEDDDAEYEHGNLNGSWSLIYDPDLDCTYLIFTPPLPDEQQELRLLASVKGSGIESTTGGGTDAG